MKISTLLTIAALVISVTLNHAETFSPELWTLIVRSANLSTLIYQTRKVTEEFGSDYYYDGYDDAALIDTSIADTCIVVFRGSMVNRVRFFLRDWRQNLSLRRESFCNKQDASYCCETPKGQIKAYETNYQQELETKIETECSGKEIVFTGHSQGALVAEVAALRFAHLNPKLLLFAPPAAAFENPCLSPLITNDMIGFINTRARGLFFKELIYDPVSAGSNRVLRKYTPEVRIIVLPPDDGTSAAAYDSFPDIVNFPFTVRFDIHAHWAYDTKFDAIDEATNGVGLDLSGFPSGTPCKIDSECSSGSCESPIRLFRTCR